MRYLTTLASSTQFALPEFDLAVFVLSSTGEGEPPDNARSFWRFLVRKTHPKDLMARLKLTILGSASFPPPCALPASPSASPCSLMVVMMGMMVPPYRSGRHQL